MEEIDKVLRQNPKQVSALFSKAEALYGSGMFEKAMIQHVRGHRLRPDFRNKAFKKGMRLYLSYSSQTFQLKFLCSICKIAICEALENFNFEEEGLNFKLGKKNRTSSLSSVQKRNKKGGSFSK